jgi:hypothetical protein
MEVWQSASVELNSSVLALCTEQKIQICEPSLATFAAKIPLEQQQQGMKRD